MNRRELLAGLGGAAAISLCWGTPTEADAAAQAMHLAYDRGVRHFRLLCGFNLNNGQMNRAKSAIEYTLDCTLYGIADANTGDLLWGTRDCPRDYNLTVNYELPEGAE